MKATLKLVRKDMTVAHTVDVDEIDVEEILHQGIMLLKMMGQSGDHVCYEYEDTQPCVTKKPPPNA